MAPFNSGKYCPSVLRKIYSFSEHHNKFTLNDLSVRSFNSMKSNKLFLLILTLSFLSCNTLSDVKDEVLLYDFFTDQITMNELLTTKESIDNSKNPAEALLLKNTLSKKILKLDGITVKDIVNSTNVDYDFCVLADVQSGKGMIECYIYTKNIRRISLLKKGQTIIDVKGKFNRYFSMLDNYYTKIEITNSEINIKKE